MQRKKKEKEQIMYIEGRNDQIATNAKLLDIMHESYEISIDLIEAIN